MNQILANNPFYTVGMSPMTDDRLLDIVKRFDINCVVDIRTELDAFASSSYSCQKMQSLLKDSGIFFLPFYNSFGSLPQNAYYKNGKINYNKAIQSDQFNKGMQRLRVGNAKGYHILLLDKTRIVDMSVSISLIGHTLIEEGFQVFHIQSSGFCLSHRQYLELDAFKKKQKFDARKQALALGEWGEDMAVLFLKNKGMIILHRNWNLHHGCELDIVAYHDNILHFVEVKTRSSDAIAPPQEAIDQRKMQHIRRAANKYRHMFKYLKIPYQIDSIAIVRRSDDDYDLNYYERLVSPIVKVYR